MPKSQVSVRRLADLFVCFFFLPSFPEPFHFLHTAMHFPIMIKSRDLPSRGLQLYVDKITRNKFPRANLTLSVSKDRQLS